MEQIIASRAAKQPGTSNAVASISEVEHQPVSKHVVQIEATNEIEAVPPAPPETVNPEPIAAASDAAMPVEFVVDKPVVAIDLPTALALTSGQNPQVQFARHRIQEALSRLEAADALWLPSLRAGANYNKHEGRIQDVAGNIIDTSRGSFYTGFGAQAVGAGSPAVPGVVMNFHLRDAVFQPQIAEQTLGARQHASQAATNDALMESALAYVDLLEAAQVKAVADETLANTQQLVRLTQDFAETGGGLQADFDRARAELAVRENAVRRAQESMQVASVRLNRLLSQAQNSQLVPADPMLYPVEFVARDSSVQQLVATGLSNRPELCEARYLVGIAVKQYEREKFAPLLPSVLLGMSYGGNGGGLGGDIERYGDRFDFDVAAFWEVRNLGIGEKAARDAACSQIEQAKWQQVRMMDQVAGEVAEAHAQTQARFGQIEVAQEGIKAAELSFQRNSERIRDGQGLPLETLQSIQALDLARREYVRSVADFNRAQFRLQRALGWPVH